MLIAGHQKYRYHIFVSHQEDNVAPAPFAVDASETGPEALDIAELTAEIVSAYVSHNPLTAAQLPDIIISVAEALRENVSRPAQQPVASREPAVPIKKSVTREAIICLECGKRFRSIRRHLGNAHNLDPDEYRAKWDLPRDYPMTAPSYAERRSELAKSMGLGRQGKGG